MITAAFKKTGDALFSVTISGHAGYARSGRDIVCAAVTSATMMTANAITEVLHTPAEIQVKDNLISIRLPEPFDPAALQFIQALYLQIDLLAGDYTKNIRLTLSEV